MRGNMISIILAFICVGFVVGSAYSFMVPYEMEQLILVGDNFGILDDLTVPSHTSFPWRSFNQSIDIFIVCTNGSLDIIIFKSMDWIAWDAGENVSTYYEARNVSSLVLSVVIEPSYYYTIDIIMQTNYGDAWMDISMYSRWWGYDDSSVVTSLLVAIPFAIGSYYFTPKKSKNENKSTEMGII
ncbi:hypothetical protein EU528_13725 [Candidatus Thorarchaeota archaeon]|nr:MAG: hypothetical protein EU528_13725 [Candidatus Thorarchaeota archaeon]